MSNNDVREELFPLEETLCKNCMYRISRTIIPIDPEVFGLDEDMINNMDLEDGEDIMLEQHTCIVLNQDMDYIVVTCNLFKDIKDASFFKNELFR